MTDNRTTELREMLTERGARYEKPEDDTTIYYDGDGNRYTYNVNPDSGWAQLFGYNLTPEQAIAATLGNDRESELLAALNKAAGNWAKADARARELESATLGGGECEWVLEHSGALYTKSSCSECGFVFVEPLLCREYLALEPNFCPCCGKAVKR